MSYQLVNSITVGPAYAAKQLVAKLYDSLNNQVGGTISTTFFVRPGSRGIIVHTTTIPNGHVGWIDYYFSDDLVNVIESVPINQAEAIDALTSFGTAKSSDIASISSVITANNPPSIDVGKITLRRASTFDCQITNVSVIPSDWQYALFTVKEGLNIRDSKSILQIKATNGGSASDGLKILGGKSTGITQSDASMTVDYSSKIVTIHIEDHSTVLLSTNNVGFLYDIKFFNGTSDSVATSPSRFVVIDAVTEEV